ncbi:putative enzyme related to lactoylglutathione lyase [Sphingopyxis sp. LC81]|uniref:VOC family protein n=1 Tax=Sphingopyxis sp. LC81 TaxID=1502850 RepID=UPI00050E12C0|nr:VOC family protein [Sphingopyxis sp. LC81]KGB54007.1 putative enzyme related to lactoylglutathione lyase [Sphingopyxis sp. LC81]
MKLEKMYPSLLTADLAAAEHWYSKLFGRGPDYRPMATLLHWELSGQGGLMLASSEEIASRGSIFLYVADLGVERTRLEKGGILIGSDISGDYSTLAQVRDPDGNLITLASPPSAPFPRPKV